ncbi:glucose 1-dehydrogenase [Azospirillum sp.]|uniref:glucose 1-dehydrogenase n=1 Tax=Azospirillum sp. TaxID=34012 RepID=UPI002D4918F2|nr:glucose 1-dehydrogenase [Azospirillum sp.]HYD70106.1 glucose 1-dehydrogenase [Azospirillum sp.]
MSKAVLPGLAGKVAIITGGATSIGAAVVRAFAGAGGRVAIADIQADAGRRLAEELGTDAQFVATDLTDDAQIDACVAATVERFGRIDFLVNVACAYVDQGFATTRAEWRTALDVNLIGGVMMARAVHPHMVAAGGGAIVNFGSVSGRVAQAGRWTYPASKAAVMQVTRSQALDLARDRIRVNSVSPGWTWSAILDQLSKGDMDKVNAVAAPFHPLGRIGLAEEVANAVLYLCSDQASFVTGTDLAVDGGYGAIGPERGEAAIAALMG